MNGKTLSAPKMAVVVVNYRRADDTIRCIESLLASAGMDPFIVIVDNASGDGGAEKVEAAFPSLKLIRNDKNLGYAGGNNVGIREALKGGADYILVLNNDCVVASSALKEMLMAADSCGIVSPMIYDYFKRDLIQYAGYKNIHILAQAIPVGEGRIDRGQFDRARALNAAPGCAMLVSRKVFETIGFFDERFFAYSEEIDLCRRAIDNGFRILFAPRAKVWHKKAATLDARSPEYLYYLTRGRLIYARKHLNWPAFMVIFLPYFFLAKLAKPSAVALATGRGDDIRALWRAVWWNTRNRLE